MSLSASHLKNRERGATLVELLVTLTIFASVTIIVTSSFLSIVSSRNQIEVSQQLNDEFRLLIDTMEIEISSGNDFSRSDCVNGPCRTMSFNVATRPDLARYQVIYTYDEATKKIKKTMQRNDGICNSLPLPPECTFPVTSDNINISFVNFDIVLAGTGPQRPLISVIIEGEGLTDTGEVIPLSYSTSYTPRIIQNVSSVTMNTDTINPYVRFGYIVAGTGSGAGCTGVYSDSALTVPYDNSLNFTLDQQPLPDAYTDCDSVKVSFFGKDEGSGLEGGRYDGYVNVLGGLCQGQACSETPRTKYSLPFGTPLGVASEVNFIYDNIPLRPGIGVNGEKQNIYLRVKDMQGNFNSPESIISIYQMSAKPPLTTDGMIGLARLACFTAGQPEIQLSIAPSSDDNPDQKNVKWYRCTAEGENDACVPNSSFDGGLFGDDMELQWRSPWMWRRIAGPGTGSWLGRHPYSVSNYWNDSANPRPSIHRNTLYRYGFVVYDKYDSTRVSDIKIIEWDKGFNAALLSNPDLISSSGYSDNDVRFADGRAFLSTPYIGRIPNDFCPAPGDDTTGDAGIPVVDDDDDDSGSGSDDPQPPTYTILPAVAGVWSASVTLVSGGSIFTNEIPITMNGDAPSVTISIKSITPAFTGVELNPINVALTQTIPTRNIFLRIPSDMAVGVYSVELELSGTNAPAEVVTVPLYVDLQSGGAL